MLPSPILKNTQLRLPRRRPLPLNSNLLPTQHTIPHKSLNTPLRNPIRPQPRNSRPRTTIPLKHLQHIQTPHILRNRPHHIPRHSRNRTKPLLGLTPQTRMNQINLNIRKPHTHNIHTRCYWINLFGNQTQNTGSQLPPPQPTGQKV